MARVKIDRIVVNKTTGVPIATGSCNVTLRGVGTAATLYNAAGSTITNPTTITTGAMNAYVDEGSYDLNISGAGFTSFVSEFEAWRGDSLHPAADPAVGVAGLRTIGTGALQAAPGTLAAHTRLTGPLSDFNTSTWTPVEDYAIINVSVASPTGPTLWSPRGSGTNVVNGSRVLLMAQTAPAENGIYIYNGSGTPMTRATDANTSAQFVPGRMVTSSATNSGSYVTTTHVYTGVASPTIGTTALTFMRGVSPGYGEVYGSQGEYNATQTISIFAPRAAFYLFACSSTAYLTGTAGVRTVFYKLDGSTNLCQSGSYFATTNVHTTVPTAFGKAYLTAGTHTVSITPQASQLAVDSNDTFSLAMWEAQRLL